MYTFAMTKEGIKQRLLVHPIVTRLLNNPNWEPAARAAVAELVEGKKCPVTSWRKSSTWQQVKMAFDEITEGT
jgi:hypothetical protein